MDLNLVGVIKSFGDNFVILAKTYKNKNKNKEKLKTEPNTKVCERQTNQQNKTKTTKSEKERNFLRLNVSKKTSTSQLNPDGTRNN